MAKGKKQVRYPIEKILDSTEVDGFGFMEYFVKWDGYDEKDNTWESRVNLVGDEVFEEYEKKRIADAEKNLLSSGRPKRGTDSKYAKDRMMTPVGTSIKKPTRSSACLHSNREESTPMSRPKRNSVSKISGKKDTPTPVSRPKRHSVSKVSGKRDTPTTRLKRHSGSKKSGKKGTPTTRLKHSSTQKRPEAMEAENPIEQEVVEAPIDRAEHEQEVEPEAMEIVDIPIEQERVEAPIYRAEHEKVTAVLGCRQERDQSVWVMCSFNKDANETEITPYNVVSQHHPQILLNFFHANFVYVDAENNA